MTPKMKATSRSQGIQSVSKALELLCCFSSDHPDWGVTEVANYLGLCKSAAYRILATCEEYQFVVRTPTHRYRLGTRALELGNIYRFERRLLWKGEPAMRQLADETHSVAHLGELDGRDVLELLRSAGQGARIFTSSPRLRGPAHATAMGKILLAFGGEETFAHFVGPMRTFKRFTRYTIVSPEALKQELETVAAQGYAVSDQECVVGCRCVAVPVRNRQERVIAALSVSNTPEIFCERELPRVLSRLTVSAETISRETTE
jgi:DNA-binding IclR family transcriptional regulator